MAWKVPIIFPPDVDEANFSEEVEQAAGDVYFTEEEIVGWTGTQAVRWILNAGHAFEVLGLRPKKFGNALLRRRFLRLSLLTHPDKNPHEEAASAFRKLSDSMRVLTSENGQEDLLQSLFPGPAAAEADGHLKTRKNQEPNSHTCYKGREMDQDMDPEDAAEADREHSDFAKRRRSLSEILQAQKRQNLGRRPGKAKVATIPSKKAKGAWGLPEHCLPPENQEGRGSAANPQILWRFAGLQALSANGWQRLESRSRPGRFYFLHTASGKRQMDEGPLDGQAEELPPNWHRHASRNRPGVFYYVNSATGERRSELPKTS